MDRPRIAIVGSYGVGMTVRTTAWPAAGQTVVGRSFVSEHGGKGSNQAVAAARLGGAVSFLTALGQDEFADRARRLWADEGIAAEPVVVQGVPTMVAAVLVDDASGENRIIIVAGALDHLTPGHVRNFAAAIESAQVCLVQLEIGVDAAREALRIAREHGVTTVLNPAPFRPLDDDILRLADHLLPNEGEAAALAGIADPEAAASALHRSTGATVAVTLGPQGVLLLQSGREPVRVPAPAVRAVDTVGAGDTFAGAYAVAIASGRDPVQASQFGNAAAALSVTRIGVVPAIPHLADLDPAS